MLRNRIILFAVILLGNLHTFAQNDTRTIDWEWAPIGAVWMYQTANSNVKKENLPAEDLTIGLCVLTDMRPMIYTGFSRTVNTLDVRSLQNSIYFVQISNKNSTYIYSNKIIKI